MTTVPDSIVHELMDDDIARLIRTISDVFPNLAGPLAVPVDPSIELGSIRAFCGRGRCRAPGPPPHTSAALASKHPHTRRAAILSDTRHEPNTKDHSTTSNTTLVIWTRLL
jgi:hypothetical protein